MRVRFVVFVIGSIGRTVYEWEQSLEEVNVFIAPPPGVTAAAFDIKIDVNHIRIGIKGNPPFMDVRYQLNTV